MLFRSHGKPDTFIVTGDIDAMWMRDSSAQVWPYVQLAKQDKALQQLFRGLIRRHARCIRIDPYANAFMPDPTAKSNLDWAQHDLTDMKPGVAERKWEIDSLCYPIRLAHGYWKATGDTAAFDDDWHDAMRIVLRTFRENSFAAPVIKIQEERGQKVIDTGPYALVRHPMYAGAFLYVLGTPLVLGSWIGLALVPLVMGLLIVRIFIEEAALRKGLPGYDEYTTRVRYRLMPRIW